MRKLVDVGVWVVLATGGAARADDAEVKAVIEKAIKAHGGADVLNKFLAFSAKSKGKYYGMGEGIDYTSETQIQYPDKERFVVQAGDFKFTQVVNGDKGWIVAGAETRAMDKEQLEEAREELYAAGLTRLTPLTGAGYKLAALGSVKVGDRDAVGVRVEHKGHRDVSLFFDKDTGLLLKMERRGKDVMGGGGEFTAEEIFGDYKKVDGMSMPFKITIKHDGKRFVESETTEATPAEKLDASVFAKP
jgi:hypothetical protein